MSVAEWNRTSIWRQGTFGLPGVSYERTGQSFGVAASDMSEMALGEVADTIRKLQIQERKQRTFVERKTADYNVDNKQEITTERGQDNGSNHIRRQGDYLLPNLIIPEEEEVHLGKYAYLRNQYLMKNRYGMYLNLLTAGTLNQHLLQTEEEAQMRMETLILQMAEKEGVTEELKAESDGVDRAEDNIRRRAKEIVRQNSGELKWHDRSSEDHEIAFLSNDEIIKSLLLFAPHLKATNAEISDFYESHEERKAQMEYVKSLFQRA